MTVHINCAAVSRITGEPHIRYGVSLMDTICGISFDSLKKKYKFIEDSARIHQVCFSNFHIEKIHKQFIRKRFKVTCPDCISKLKELGL